MSDIWIRKYAPSNGSEVHGQSEGVEKLRNYIKNHSRGSKATFLHGGNGSGKTSAVVALANELDLELVELNASDTRNAAAITQLLGGAINQASLFGGGKIVLIDEIDGASGTKDRGGLATIVKMISKSAYPIVVVAADATNRKFKALRKECNVVEFEKLDVDSVFVILKNIADKEKVEYDERALKQLARISGGDARAAINDLQTISYLGKKITVEDVNELGERNTTNKIEDALQRVFKTTNAGIALRAYDEIAEDLDKIFLWVEENLPKEYLEPEALSRAFDNLSLADVFFGRIRRWQYYRFYVYCYNLLSAGIAIAKDKKNDKKIKYVESSRILKIWIYNNANAKKKSIAAKVAQNTHCGSYVAFHSTVPYLQSIFKNDKKQVIAISDELDLSDDEVDWLKRK